MQKEEWQGRTFELRHFPLEINQKQIWLVNQRPSKFYSERPIQDKHIYTQTSPNINALVSFRTNTTTDSLTNYLHHRQWVSWLRIRQRRNNIKSLHPNVRQFLIVACFAFRKKLQLLKQLTFEGIPNF